VKDRKHRKQRGGEKKKIKGAKKSNVRETKKAGKTPVGQSH